MTVTTDLSDLRKRLRLADDAFTMAVREVYPAGDRYTWYRACENVKAGKADSYDTAMTAHPGICAAHDAYLDATHAFYEARDGAKGFLGKYEKAPS